MPRGIYERKTKLLKPVPKSNKVVEANALLDKVLHPKKRDSQAKQGKRIKLGKTSKAKAKKLSKKSLPLPPGTYKAKVMGVEQLNGGLKLRMAVGKHTVSSTLRAKRKPIAFKRKPSLVDVQKAFRVLERAGLI
jgi:hypothetical protein